MTEYPLAAMSIDHLLLNGFIVDRGQLSLLRRSELEWRTKRGELIKENLFSATLNRIFTVWRLPNVQIPDKVLP